MGGWVGRISLHVMHRPALFDGMAGYHVVFRSWLMDHGYAHGEGCQLPCSVSGFGE